jgi:DNA-binding response OmpR family regulator
MVYGTPDPFRASSAGRQSGRPVAHALLIVSEMTSPKRPHRILLADEDESVLVGLGDYFSWLGFQVDMASTVEEAQSLLRLRDYSAVVADLRLAGTSARPGCQISRMARALSERTRIVLLSASPLLDVDARRHGADLVLQKPRPLAEVAWSLISLLEGTA